MTEPGADRVRAIDAVVFDVNETLLDLGPIAAAFRDAGLDPKRVDAWFRAVLVDGISASATGTFASFPDIARHVLSLELADAGLDTGSGAERRILGAFEQLGFHPDVGPALTRLHAAGVPAATLTNGTAGVVQGALERAALTALVAHTWDVTEVGRWKPAAEPYLWAAAQLGLPPARVALVAVHPWDVHGARVAGLHGVWIDRRGDRRYPAHLHAPHRAHGDLTTAIEHLVR